MYRNKFNDIEPGTIFINKDRTKLYEIIGMFSAYLRGTLLITRNLSGEANNFAECSYIANGKNADEKLCIQLTRLDQKENLIKIEPNWKKESLSTINELQSEIKRLTDELTENEQLYDDLEFDSRSLDEDNEELQNEIDYLENENQEYSDYIYQLEELLNQRGISRTGLTRPDSLERHKLILNFYD